MVMIKFNDKSFYFEKAVGKVINTKLKEVEDDNDLIITITAGEGYGKSLFARQLGALISKQMRTKFNIDNIHFSTDDLMKAAENSSKYTVHILDESRAELYRGSSNSKKNLKFTHWLSECRSKNLIIIICLPSLHDLDNYITKWRVGMWINMQKVRDDEGVYRRGYYSVMAIKRRKQYLKFLSEKYMPIPENLKVLKGKFTKIDPLDSKEYEKKKEKHRLEKFIELEEDKPLEFNDLERETISNALVILKCRYKSSTKEYKRVERLIKKLSRADIERHATRDTLSNIGDKEK